MVVTPAEEIPFEEDDYAAVVDAIDLLSERGTGWINLVPEVHEDHQPAPRSFAAWVFASRGEPVPMITWTPPARPGGRASVGIAHGAGPRGLARLAGAGLTLPPGWIKVTDHARRGIVCTVPDGADRSDAVHWLLTAAHVLCAAPLTGSWLARVYST
ncbi:MAG: hypothetical protein KF906_00440 [Actinobacteria bacterium]|nr:hypothetical protein [Actinomycetota bacterium]